MKKSNVITSNNPHQYTRIAITVFSFWLLVINMTTAQNSWRGGTPGAENKWSNPKNWSENRVPDWRDETVIIPNVISQSGHFPIVNSNVPEVAHLRLEGGAVLTIGKQGKLIIDGESTYNFGILNVGKVINFGLISIENTGMDALENYNNHIINKGAIALIDESDQTHFLATH